MEERLAIFVEHIALFYEDGGLPRIAGRILGWLLVCEPPWRSAPELAEELQISKGSVSTMTRLLMEYGLLERIAQPGERATFFRVNHDGFERVFAKQLLTAAAGRELIDEGLELLHDEPRERLARLKGLKALYAFFEREMPRLLEAWRKERDAAVDKL